MGTSSKKSAAKNGTTGAKVGSRKSSEAHRTKASPSAATSGAETRAAETFEGYLLLRDTRGIFFSVDRHGKVYHAPDCIGRIDNMLEATYTSDRVNVIMAVRALVLEIERLQEQLANQPQVVSDSAS